MRGKKTILLLDGDVLCFVAAAAAQKDLLSPDGAYVYRWSVMAEGEAILDKMVLRLLEEFGCGRADYMFALSDPETNWRHGVLPSYKSNRSVDTRPQLLGHLKSYARGRHSAFHWPTLEADDVLGIMATDMAWAPAAIRTVVVTKDKDLRSVPGEFHRLGGSMRPGQTETITRRAADLFHLRQTLAGDIVDGYTGCPGMGMARAEALLAEPVRLVPSEGVITRGKNKGRAVVKWGSVPTDDLWECVVTHYEKQGLTEEDALTQARVARILRGGEFEQETGKVNLWTPDALHDEEGDEDEG